MDEITCTLCLDSIQSSMLKNYNNKLVDFCNRSADSDNGFDKRMNISPELYKKSDKYDDSKHFNISRRESYDEARAQNIELQYLSKHLNSQTCSPDIRKESMKKLILVENYERPRFKSRNR